MSEETAIRIAEALEEISKVSERIWGELSLTAGMTVALVIIMFLMLVAKDMGGK